MLTKERKKQLDIDLWLIVIITMLCLGSYMIFNRQINGIGYNANIPVLLRVLLMGAFQFGIAGLGITVVSLIRKESFIKYGLNSKNLILTVALSALCCVPDLIYTLASGHARSWLPFTRVDFTHEVLKSGFPVNVAGMLLIAACWGFFEGFNYVVIADKISERYPTKSKFWDWGAFICAIICILIHGAVGVTPDAIVQMVCIILLIYGMLIVRKNTGNAWGCVLIFFAYWNAL